MAVMSNSVACCGSCEVNTDINVASGTDLMSRDVTVKSGVTFWGQSVDPISEELARKITFSTGLFLVPLLTLLGVPGNIVSAVVFYRQGLRERINLCLFALAIVDLFVVLDLFFIQFEYQIRALFLPHAWFFATKVPCLIGFVSASQLLSAVIASERCFCVVSPFHAKRLLKTSTMAAIIVVCCFIIVGGMSTIACPKYTVVDIFDPVTNRSKQMFSVTSYYLEKKDIMDFFDIFVYATCLPGIFLVIIIVATVITVISLRSAVSQRQIMTRANNKRLESKTSSLSSKEVTVTRMLIGTSLLFIVCLSPNFVVQVTTLVIPDLSLSGKYYNTKVVTWALTSFLRVVNCSVNTCVYYILSSKFRKVLYGICWCNITRRLQLIYNSNTGQKGMTALRIDSFREIS